MRFYLSSYKVGNESGKLLGLMPASNHTIGYIPNAADFAHVDLVRRAETISENTDSLSELGLEVSMLNLRDYFGKKRLLRNKLKELGGVFVAGGNTFVLRQAMKLSGFDEIITEMKKTKADFLYAGYSAGICVLAPNLKALQIVDDSTQTPYPEQKEVIWEGLGFLDHIILPHYKSDHPESEDIDKEVEYCEKNNVPYKTLRDGEVLIMTF